MINGWANFRYYWKVCLLKTGSRERRSAIMQRSKWISLLFLIATLVSIFLLSASLPNLRLQKGGPFPGGLNSDSGLPAAAVRTAAGEYALNLLRGVLALVFLALMIYIPLRLLALVNVRRILIGALILTGTLLLIVLLSGIQQVRPSQSAIETIGIATQSTIEPAVTPLGEPPRGLVQLVLIAFVLGGGLLVIRALRQLPRAGVKDRLLEETEGALNAIRTGEDLRNVIIRCYFQMTRALGDERNIERNHDMTAREFEALLAARGFPDQPVHRLTGLFEKARYGELSADTKDEELAVASLSEIIQFCRKDEADEPA